MTILLEGADTSEGIPSDTQLVREPMFTALTLSSRAVPATRVRLWMFLMLWMVETWDDSPLVLPTRVMSEDSIFRSVMFWNDCIVVSVTPLTETVFVPLTRQEFPLPKMLPSKIRFPFLFSTVTEESPFTRTAPIIASLLSPMSAPP